MERFLAAVQPQEAWDQAIQGPLEHLPALLEAQLLQPDLIPAQAAEGAQEVTVIHVIRQVVAASSVLVMRATAAAQSLLTLKQKVSTLPQLLLVSFSI
jgi:hypothetical protein